MIISSFITNNSTKIINPFFKSYSRFYSDKNSNLGKVLLLSNSYNGLTQKVHCYLKDKIENPVLVELAINGNKISEIVNEHKPEWILCPFLKKQIPSEVWKEKKCIVIHPGIKGDRGASSLDWAILSNKEKWGVTLLSAVEGMDEGPVWSSKDFSLDPKKSKTLTYSDEVSKTALLCIDELLTRINDDQFQPEVVDFDSPSIQGKLMPTIKQSDRKIDFQTDSTEEILRKINASCSQPGVLTEFFGEDYFLYDCYEESILKGNPGEIIAQRDQAICIGTRDAAVWVTHLKKKDPKPSQRIKLPATLVLKNKIKNIPFNDLDINYIHQKTFKQINYHKEGKLAFLSFNFYNGAMNSYQCEKLINAYDFAVQQSDTELIVISGGPQSWSNGINLNTIEANEFPEVEAWKNLYLINSFIKKVINTKTHLTCSFIGNSAGAGGVPMALAADLVFAKDGIILNPHYQNMGLYGSELWTYLLPKRVGFEMAKKLTDDCLPLNTNQAKKINLIDQKFSSFEEMKQHLAEIVATKKHIEILSKRVEERIIDENQKPLLEYEREEMNIMYRNLFENNWGFKEKRRDFVYKVPPNNTPDFLLRSNATALKNFVIKEEFSAIQNS